MGQRNALQEARRRFEQGEYDCIIGVDPGQKATTAALHSKAAEDDLRGNGDHYQVR